GQTLTLTLGEITIDENLTIDGSSLPSPVTVSGGGTSRVFVVNAGVTVAITGLTITDGAAPGSGTDYETYGGAILNFGTLSLADCTVSNSDAPEADGGGIFSVGPLTVTRCTITGNHARFYGGGIALEGEATIRNSTISG